MNVGVCYLGRRVDRIHVSWPGLNRYPFHGLVGAIAWRFDGRTLKLVWTRLPERPKARS